MSKRVFLELGDEVVVNGSLFILTEVNQKLGEPTKIVFEQPVERMRKAKVVND